MFDYIFEWIQNVVFYLVIITAVIQVIPGKNYKKYIQFFSGLVMILLMLTPILKLTGMEGTFQELYHSKEYEMEKESIEAQQQYFEDLNILDFLPDEYNQSMEADTGAGEAAGNNTGTQEDEKNRTEGIEVEEIRIGE